MSLPGYQTNPLKNRLSKEEFIRLHHDEGLSQKDIAERFDVSTAYVIRLRKQYGVATKRRCYKDGTTEKPRVSLVMQTTPAEINRLYNEDRMSCAMIAELYNVSRKTVHKYIKTHGIEIRDKSQARQLALKAGRLGEARHYEINEDFFKHWSHTMAWVLGLLFTDGNMSLGPSGCLTISLASISLHLLECVRVAMNSTHPIKLVNQSFGGTIYVFTFSRKTICDDLVKLGLTPKKSLTMIYPALPKEFEHHFIRGVFDGDGSVFSAPQMAQPPKVRVHFVSGSEAFIYALESKLHQHAGVRKQNIHHRTHDNGLEFKYGQEDSLRLFDYFYKETSPAIRFADKFNKYIECMEACGVPSQDITERVAMLESMPAAPPAKAFPDQCEPTAPKPKVSKPPSCRFRVRRNGVTLHAGKRKPGSDGETIVILSSRTNRIPIQDQSTIDDAIRGLQERVDTDLAVYRIEYGNAARNILTERVNAELESA